MQKYDVSKFIISSFLSQVLDDEKSVVNRILINEIVDGWNNSIYFQSKKQLKINSYISQKYNIM